MVKEVALIGRRHTAMPYKMLGFDVIYCVELEDAKRYVEECVKKDSYAIIYVEDIFYTRMKDFLEKQVETISPAIIMIPSLDGNEDDASKRISEMVETAIGKKIV